MAECKCVELQRPRLYGNDWDVLIVMDTCRYDYFQKALLHYDWNGVLDVVDCEAGCTDSWYNKHFPKTKRFDACLITAHPQVAHCDFWVAFEHYHCIKTIASDWILPTLSYHHALCYQAEHPAERIIIHTLPPHLPYMTVLGRRVMESIGYDMTKEAMRTGRMSQALQAYGKQYGFERIREAYNQNLHLGMQAIDQYYWRFRGRVAITADHGELLGEHEGCFEHRSKWVCHNELRRVPWFQFNN